MFKTELKKALFSPYNACILLFVTVMVIWNSTQSIIRITDELEAIKPFFNTEYFLLGTYSWYNALIVKDHVNNSAYLLFFLLPLLVLIPYAWSMCEEHNSGYIRNIATRVNVRKYSLIKSCAVFITGFTVVFCTLILSLIILSLFLPFYMPEVRDQLYVGMYADSLFGTVYYTNPVLYLIGQTLYTSFFAGAWAMFVSQLYLLIKNKFLLIALPFVFLIALDLTYKTLLKHFFPYQLSFFDYWSRIMPSINGQENWFMGLGIPLALLVFSFVLLFFNTRKAA